jgi:hypothetical protein
MTLDQLRHVPIRLDGAIIGVHAILRPDSHRTLALMVAASGKHYTVYFDQASDNLVEITCEQVPVLETAPHRVRASIER